MTVETCQRKPTVPRSCQTTHVGDGRVIGRSATEAIVSREGGKRTCVRFPDKPVYRNGLLPGVGLTPWSIRYKVHSSTIFLPGR